MRQICFLFYQCSFLRQYLQHWKIEYRTQDDQPTILFYRNLLNMELLHPRSNLWLLPGSGEILYYSASIAVLFREAASMMAASYI
jgi:hypothetical protein